MKSSGVCGTEQPGVIAEARKDDTEMVVGVIQEFEIYLYISHGTLLVNCVDWECCSLVLCLFIYPFQGLRWVGWQ